MTAIHLIVVHHKQTAPAIRYIKHILHQPIRVVVSHAVAVLLPIVKKVVVRMPTSTGIQAVLLTLVVRMPLLYHGL